jgi:hypothetical protein
MRCEQPGARSRTLRSGCNQARLWNVRGLCLEGLELLGTLYSWC